MARIRQMAAILAFVPVALAPIACGGDNANDRDALNQDELGRDLDLALGQDSLTTTFEDTAAAEQPNAEPAPPAPTTRSTAPAPRRTQPAPRQPQPAPEPAPQPREVTRTVPAGTSLALTLNETLSTETNHQGDSFSATLAEPIMDANGMVLIPAGATVNGTVTGVQKSGHVGETAVLKLAFQSISSGGKTYPLEASVLEANPERKNRTSTGANVGKVAAGAAAGAILGKVLGKSTGSTVKGAVIGAAAGTAIAMGTADVDAVLPAGSRVVIRLDAPVDVKKTIS